MTSEDKLIKLYETAVKELYREIAYKDWYGNSTGYQRALLDKVKATLKKLKRKTPGAVREALEQAYATGLTSFCKDTDTAFTPRVNWRQLDIMIQNAVDQLTVATNRVGRIWQDAIRRAGVEATKHKMATGQTVNQMRRQLAIELYNLDLKGRNGKTGIATKRGTMGIVPYAALVARSTTAEAQNAAKIDAAGQHGYDLARFTSHAPKCAVCAQYEGRVYALTKEAANGKYKGTSGEPLRFPYLYDTAFASGYNNIHPNCRHRLTIIVPALCTPEQLTAWSRQSMRPFVDTRGDRERKAYAAAQAKNRARWQDRRQWEKYRALLPDQTPANFGAFRTMKQSESQRWKDLQADYRYILENSRAYKGLPLLSKNTADDAEIDSRSIEAINNAVTRFGKDFPLVREWIQSQRFVKEDAESVDNPASCNFSIDKSGKVSFELVYSAKEWYDYDVIKELVTNEAKIGEHIKTEDPQAVIYHELGHAAHNALALKRSEYTGGENLSPLQVLNFSTERDKIAQHMYIMLFSDESYEEIMSCIEREISKRATHNGREFIAECFSQYYAGEASRMAKKVIKYFQEELKRS